jgi:hypothetical protein
LLRWHREVWLLEQPHPAHPDALTATELTKAWHNTRKAMGDGMGWHIDTPVAGAIRAARLVGWDLDQPGRLTDGAGEIKLNERSPASLQTTYRRQWEEHLPQQWLRSKLQQTPASPERDTLLAEGVDLQPLTKVLRAAGKSALRPVEKRKVLQFFAGTLRHHFQHDRPQQCQLCGEPDGFEHRLASCKVTLAWLEEHPRVAKAVRADPPGSLAATKGWRPKPQQAPRPDEVAVQVTEVDTLFDPNRPIYVDGSCFEGTDKHAAATGAAAVQYWPDPAYSLTNPPKPSFAAWLTVPGYFPQAAATGEHLGVWLANFLSAGPYSVYADCAGVVAAHQNGRQWAVGPDRPYGAVWALLRTGDLKITKTRAHRSLEAAVADNDTEHFWGNWLADNVAKAAADGARLPKDERELHQAAQWRARAVLKARGQILAKWTPQGQPAKKDRGSQKPPLPKTLGRRRHRLVWQPGSTPWACTLCHGGFRTIKRASQATCKAVPHKQLHNAKAAALAKHKLMLADAEGYAAPVMYCDVCGQFSQQRAAGLLRQCPGWARNTSTRIERIRQGLHPTDKKCRLSGHRPFAMPPSQRTEAPTQRSAMSPLAVQAPLVRSAGQASSSQQGQAGPLGPLSVQLSELDLLQLAEGEQHRSAAQEPLSEEDEDPLGLGLSLD